MTMIYNKITIKEANISKGRLLKKFEQNLNHLNKKEKNTRWQEENKEAIQHYNERVEKYGVFSDGLRSF